MDKTDRSHLLEVVDSLEPCRVRDREGSVEVGSSGDTPLAREMCAGKEGGSVIRNVVDDVVDNLLREPRVAGLTSDSLRLPDEVLAREPQCITHSFGICSRRRRPIDA